MTCCYTREYSLLGPDMQSKEKAVVRTGVSQLHYKLSVLTCWRRPKPVPDTPSPKEPLGQDLFDQLQREDMGYVPRGEDESRQDPGAFKHVAPLLHRQIIVAYAVDDQTLYLVCETKATRGFLQLCTHEAVKIHCSQRHSEALGVPCAIAVAADVAYGTIPVRSRL